MEVFMQSLTLYRAYWRVMHTKMGAYIFETHLHQPLRDWPKLSVQILAYVCVKPKVVSDYQLNRIKPIPMAESNWELFRAPGVSSH